MSYTLPTFNLTCDIWHAAAATPAAPPAGAPDLSPVCNLAFGRRVAGIGNNLVMFLLLPALTDVRYTGVAGTADSFFDIVECPAGSARYYWVVSVDDAGKGFVNEHRVAELQQIEPVPVPMT